MDKLPPEILRGILGALIALNPSSKNDILPFRLVCKVFNELLREDLLKTVQLDFSRLERKGKPLDLKYLAGAAEFCDAIYVDLTIIRDDDEILRLQNAFASIVDKFPEMNDVFDSLRRYCMGPASFDESDFKNAVTTMLDTAHKASCFKLNLPFQFVGQASRSGTMLFATAAECLANRSEESAPIETMVLSHLSDTTLLDVYQNPIDLQNAIKVFKPLKHLVLSLKRQENSGTSQHRFSAALWRLITEATNLESLCIIGWNSKRNTSVRQHELGFQGDLQSWRMQSLPYQDTNGSSNLGNLRCLELNRVDVEADSLLKMVKKCASSLKELYLSEVYLKVRNGDAVPLWIGLGPEVSKPHGAKWIAEELQGMPGLELAVLRATALGYDEYSAGPDFVNHGHFDLDDPSGRKRSFDERFVEAALGQNPSSSIISKPMADYDVDSFQHSHNTTSHWRSSIDGVFYNHNDTALDELKKILSVVERGMGLLTAEIDRINTAIRFDPTAA
ncbi:hypothetical protein V502_09510 [Pseudogymnoascus sp. VKM F-4520 (FW-2644)]|nr:hypothetical protein V502_09510 [Pseudogymnoascus sp. VKM F-4520 (FW-2644)]